MNQKLILFWISFGGSKTLTILRKRKWVINTQKIKVDPQLLDLMCIFNFLIKNN
jgi:hypothetical protein